MNKIKKRVAFSVTNDLSYDQRMDRICTTLSGNEYEVTLIGVKRKQSLPFQVKNYNQVRISLLFQKGKLFYAEYNLKLFFYLLLKKYDIYGAVDLDTLIPQYFISQIKNKPLVFDAHEYFSELEEVVTRPIIKIVWKWVESIFIVRLKYAYTVNQSLADIFEKKYHLKFEVIRNVPLLMNIQIPERKEKVIIYQGWVNKGRGLEYLIEAMKKVDAQLVICGKGDIFNEIEQQIKSSGLSNKVKLLGFVLPEKLKEYTLNSSIGVNLLVNKGYSYYFSLANRFFDYMHAGIPQLTVNFPEYRKINKEYEVALFTEDISPAAIASSLNQLLNDKGLYNRLKANCLLARNVFNWQDEEKKLLAFYQKIPR